MIKAMRRQLLSGLFLCSISVAAQTTGTPRQVWLSNLRPMMANALCAPQSPLLRVYKGERSTCPAEVDALYSKCTTDVPQVTIPEMLTSERQANRYGSIIAECISAHYMGGDALKTFLMLQERSEKATGG